MTPLLIEVDCGKSICSDDGDLWDSGRDCRDDIPWPVFGLEWSAVDDDEQRRALRDRINLCDHRIDCRRVYHRIFAYWIHPRRRQEVTAVWKSAFELGESHVACEME